MKRKSLTHGTLSFPKKSLFILASFIIIALVITVSANMKQYAAANPPPPPGCYYGSSCLGVHDAPCKAILVCPNASITPQPRGTLTLSCADCSAQIANSSLCLSRSQRQSYCRNNTGEPLIPADTACVNCAVTISPSPLSQPPANTNSGWSQVSTLFLRFFGIKQ